MEKKNIKIDSKNVKIEDGRVVIDSEELANCFEDETLDILNDEKQNSITGSFSITKA